ncbi:Protein phosphatase type 2A phosphotyrosyl phosphatase activator [Giardia duodenalis assemblage B]|uniref:Serine/threonine-protein phosphatase 2A activator n=1 Tax=Giardia duodenalis assemblage B TaxID=1394984 RepID=A0A132NPA2_GIAIN|nr:Protein phosphatase type 2A phosphotyrosyl phosphatase activator [Giardia intestinalis assemblage B]
MLPWLKNKIYCAHQKYIMQQFLEPPKDFKKPEKCILNQRYNMDHFRHSAVYALITRFILLVSDSIQGLPFGNAPDPSDNCKRLLSILERAHQIFKETPPIARDVRYGNPSFRTFVQKLRENCTAWHREILPEQYQDATIELDVYFLDMFGSEKRLDYGTGHELNFICWIFSFIRLSILSERDDFINVGLRLFPAYLQLAQDIQNIYTLEPAGSHGAWSMDDYNMLPFVWGSSQLINRRLKPTDIFFPEKLVEHKDNLYIMMIQNITTVKTGDLRITSPFLSEIHLQQDANWTRIHTGMMKHYQNEVLCKWPIMQHFWFGNIIPFK